MSKKCDICNGTIGRKPGDESTLCQNIYTIPLYYCVSPLRTKIVIRLDTNSIPKSVADGRMNFNERSSEQPLYEHLLAPVFVHDRMK